MHTHTHTSRIKRWRIVFFLIKVYYDSYPVGWQHWSVQTRLAADATRQTKQPKLIDFFDRNPQPQTQHDDETRSRPTAVEPAYMFAHLARRSGHNNVCGGFVAPPATTLVLQTTYLHTSITTILIGERHFVVDQQAVLATECRYEW